METILRTLLSTLGHPVYENAVPKDGTYPCIVYQRISGYQHRSHTGNELERPRFQISCWANTYKEAYTLATAVKAVLDLNKVNFKLATKENEFDQKEVESGLTRKLLDFYIWN